MNVRWHCLSLPVFAVVLAIAEPAHGQHFDIFLARPAVGTQAVIGAADVDAQIFDGVTRVFGVDLAEFGGEFAALEPGVNHPNLNDPVAAYPSSAGGLVPGDVLRLKERDFAVGGFVDDLFYWNGEGTVSFAPAAADFRIDDGDPLGTTAGAGGSFDYHPFLVVDSVAVPGIYLASAFGVVDGFDPSDPVYLVMVTGEQFEDAHERAIEFVEARFFVPEPTSLGLASIAFVAILGVRRRKPSM